MSKASDGHMYWCVDCKTLGCLERQALRYIGPESAFNANGGASVSFPAPFTTRCGSCGTVHSYSLREDVRPRRLSFPPPLGFVDKF